MKLHHYYLRLHSHLGQGAEIPVTLDELSRTLGCTHRNALNIVTSMAKQGWIHWQPQRGRGRRSLLQLIAPPEEIAAESMLAAISRKEVHQALDQIRTHARSPTLHKSLQGWLMDYFGHHSEAGPERQMDTLRLPLRHPLHTVDPLYMNLMAEAFVSSHVFDGLVARSHSTGDIAPLLAHAWETDPTRKSWTFYLRKGVLFHSGKTMTARDVVYSFQRLLQSSHRMLYSSIFREIRTVSALSPLTVRIELHAAHELFLPFLCTSRAAIVPEELDQIGGALFGTRPVGTGPFKVVELNERNCVLEVFPYYHQGRAHLDRVEILHVPWSMNSTAEKDVSPFHIIHNPKEQKDSEWSQIHSDVSVRKFITCNTKKNGPMNDPIVRGTILASLSLPLKKNALRKREPNPAAAKEAGGRGPKLPLLVATIPQYSQDAEHVAEKLAQSGYTCSVRSVDPEEFKGGIRLEADLILFSLVRDQDEELRLLDLYQTMAGHADAATRAYMEQMLYTIRLEPSPKVRASCFAALEARLIREHQLYVLHEKPMQTAFLPSVRGVSFNNQGWIDLRRVWFPSI